MTACNREPINPLQRARETGYENDGVGIERGRARGPSQPAEAYCDHTGVESVVGRLDAGVRHVHVAILEDHGALRTEEVLEADASLRSELQPSTQLGRACMEGSIEDARAHVEKWHEAAPRLAVKAKQE